MTLVYMCNVHLNRNTIISSELNKGPGYGRPMHNLSALAPQDSPSICYAKLPWSSLLLYYFLKWAFIGEISVHYQGAVKFCLRLRLTLIKYTLTR